MQQGVARGASRASSSSLKGPKESATVFTVVENQVTEILIEAHPRG